MDSYMVVFQYGLTPDFWFWLRLKILSSFPNSRTLPGVQPVETFLETNLKIYWRGLGHTGLRGRIPA
jgi:hypothetical protein